MARGGKRPGAGRPKGSKNRLAQAAREQAEATGSLPHEVLLAICRGDQKLRDVVKCGDEMVEIERWPTVEERIRAATAAAPFYAPKLAAEAHLLPMVNDPIARLMEHIRQSPTNRARPGTDPPSASTAFRKDVEQGQQAAEDAS
jgi:hypothetical protein